VLNAGVDYHKRFSQVDVVDDLGRRIAAARLPNELNQVTEFFRSLGEPCRAVLEAGWNWGLMHDWLEGMANVTEVQLAHPYRVRAIAAAQVKTDAIDAHTLAELLRANLIPKAHIPCRETRQLRDAVRQRLFLVRLRTMVKNRIHALLDRHHVAMPPVSDIFGKKGSSYMRAVWLPEAGRRLLDQDLDLLEFLAKEVRVTEAELKEALKGDRRVELLLTVPGLGVLLSAVVALEIDDIRRFATSSKLVAYAGLVPTTHSSGGKTFQGKLIKQSNKWLRWAMVEAAWIAIRHDPYFRTHYGRRVRAKGSQTAIIAVARRLLEVIWHVLSEERAYENRPATKRRIENAPVALNVD